MSQYVLSVVPATNNSGYNDLSAVIYQDGELVFGVEEERLTRDKHAFDQFPENSVKACLDFCDIEFEELERILIPFDISRVRHLAGVELKNAFRSSCSVPQLIFRCERAIEKYLITKNWPYREIIKELKKFGEVPEVKMFSHHRCHAATAFYSSEFDSSIVLTMDWVGEHDSTVVWKGTEDGLERVRTYSFPNSLGNFYSVFTEYLGFRRLNGEGKLMGLAAYGGPNKEIRSVLDEYFKRGSDYNVEKLTYQSLGERYKILEEIFGRGRREEDITDWHKDLAFEVQKFLEDTVVSIARKYLDELGHENLAVAGGIALNCKMNQRLRGMDETEDFYPFPVASDAGTSIGAGMLEFQGRAGYESVYLGREYSDGHIEDVLNRNKIDYTRADNVEEIIAEELSERKIVGHFSGRMEMGPRALGNRSILADPRDARMKDVINRRIKFREEFRPFAPVILLEDFEEYVYDAAEAPNMVQTFDVRSEKKENIPAAMHIDGSVRPQTVSEETNPRLYRVIKRFKERTGIPASLNTSLNIRGEPIVNRPEEAIKTFYGTGMDILVLENFIIEK